ncbi:MAG: hypothetical protein BYD32DRAFT_452746, partial [Podila humilis]
MTAQGEGQGEQESPIPLQVFEFQIDPDRNTIIRRALAKRIVRQRELDEEEASTEEDESFLADDSIAVRRSITSTPGGTESPRKRTPEGQQQGKMNAKSRWKTEYLRTRSSSPSGSSTIATETVVADGSTLPASEARPNGDTLIAHEAKKDGSSDHTGSETNLMNMDKSKDKEPAPSAPETAPSEDTKAASNDMGTAREPSPDLVEQELLAKLEELKKEKSRLFALFRSTLQMKEMKEEGSSTASTSTSPAQQPSQPPLPAPPPPPPPPPPIPPQMPAEMRARESAKRGPDKETSKVEDHDKRNDPSRSLPKRREGERVIDRSKLNLEIPRKPSVSSSTTNSASSTSSTPTFGPSVASFSYPQKMKPKRPRSISPTQSHPSQPPSSNNNNNNN